jgi:hypothetical protein
MTQRTLLLPSAVVAVILAAAAAVPAQTDANHVGGRVTAIDTAAKTITVQSGGWGGGTATPTTFKVNDSTKYTVAAQGALTDLKVGQSVRVGGGPAADASSDNEIDARFIMIGGPTGGGPGGGGRRPGGGGGGGGGFSMTTGTVVTVPPDMTVATKSGTVTVDTSDDTRVMAFKAGALSDIKVGSRVMANLSSGVATTVQAMPGGRGGGGGGWRRQGGGDGGAPSGGGAAPAPSGSTQ